MHGDGSDALDLVIPADPRYLEVALVAVESLADRAGVDGLDLAALRQAVHDALAERIAATPMAAVRFRYTIGVGFLGVTLA